MLISENQIAGELSQLFAKAQEQGNFDFTLTLLRVGGIELEDPFAALLVDPPTARDVDDADARRRVYRRWSPTDHFLQLVWNLVRCAGGKSYQPFPFNDQLPWNAEIRVTANRVDQVAKAVQHGGFEYLPDAIRLAYEPAIKGSCTVGKEPEITQSVFRMATAIWTTLAQESLSYRRRYSKDHRFFRWPNFEVLETLVDDDSGLFGFRVWFSNGSRAEFVRESHRTDVINLILDREGVGYMIGSLDDLRKEWMVGAKPLFEVGLPGRYNRLGEWRPLVYEGDSGPIQSRIDALTTDLDEQGLLFYVQTTAQWVVEFAVKASVDLPISAAISFGPPEHPIRLWKCPPPEGTFHNYRLYDGWITLAEPTLAEVQKAITYIRIGMGRLAFAYDAEISWRFKYSAESPSRGLATPEEADLQRFDELLINDVAPPLDLAMSWYTEGRNAKNPFAAFICYFNAIEVLVDEVFEGDADLMVKPARIPAPERRALRRTCIEEKYKTVFPEDPSRFANEVYFECLKTLSQRRRDVVVGIWGEEHWITKAMFEKDDDGMSFSGLRDQIAHGGLTLLSTEDVFTVRSRVSKLAEIAKALIIRMLLGRPYPEPVEFWSGKFRMSASMSDPRNVKVVTSLDVLPGNDWKIRAEWLE